MARLFFAVAVSPDLASVVETRKAALRRVLPGDAVRFTDPSQSHLTLRFLGEQPAERQEAARRAGRRTAGLATAFDLVLEGLGLFPDGRRPHTLWIGTGAGGSQLAAVARHLEQELKNEDFVEEARPFVPHLTIARIKGPLSPRAREAFHEREPSLFGAMRVASFALVESRPTGRTHTHVPLEVFDLGSSSASPQSER